MHGQKVENTVLINRLLSNNEPEASLKLASVIVENVLYLFGGSI